MDLLVLRHGKAEARGGGGPDGDRTLTKKGIRDIRRVARWMAWSGIIPDLIVSSPLARAKETAEIMVERFPHVEDIAFWDELAPGSEPGTIAARFGELQGTTLLLVVGHEPQLSSLIALLIGAGEDAHIVLEKGGIARIGNLASQSGRWGELLWLLTVQQVRDMT
jgi:phosphohistidine phosphatase